MKFALPVVLLIAVVAFVAGLSVKNSLLAPFKSAPENMPEATGSSQITEETSNTPGLSGESAPVTTHQLPNNSGTYTSKTENDKIILSGTVKIPDFYKLNYNFIFPKNGGDVTGSITGVCEGNITGKSDKPDAEGEARIEGQFSGDCKPIPGLSFKTKASGTFEGQLKLKDKKVHIIYQLNEPYSTRGGFELSF